MCRAVFLDLAKAFDTVDHNILLFTLQFTGVSTDMLRWFKSLASYSFDTSILELDSEYE